MKRATRLPFTPKQLLQLSQSIHLNSSALDEALLLESSRPPFYPSDAEWLNFFVEQKHACTPLNEALLGAAAHSATARRKALIAEPRAADKQGVFSTIVVPDYDNPGQTLIIKIRRNASIGAGYGTFGGIVEAHELHNLLLALQRERREESAEILPAAIANTLCDIADRGPTLPLFKCRDDTHVIERGWGWTVDANAYVTVINDPADQQKIKALLAAGSFAPNKMLDNPSGVRETDGLAVFTLERAPEALLHNVSDDDAPASITAHFYGHEGLGEISGLEVAFRLLGINFNVRGHYFSRPAILPYISQKMGLQPASVLGLMDVIKAVVPNNARQADGPKLPKIRPSLAAYARAIS